eukprot:TRINITY_DN5618_c0_g1_i1.p2 TRINITY_DN5618_c0_g1~~TRINITY_DN5618_c0_g1_i1.p2  ORF type:complete len:174 (-),score=18.72 TRINITY_DN5618_c0_g1_i1:385-906(-)
MLFLALVASLFAQTSSQGVTNASVVINQIAQLNFGETGGLFANSGNLAAGGNVTDLVQGLTINQFAAGNIAAQNDTNSVSGSGLANAGNVVEANTINNSNIVIDQYVSLSESNTYGIDANSGNSIQIDNFVGGSFSFTQDAIKNNGTSVHGDVNAGNNIDVGGRKLQSLHKFA